MVSIQSIMKFLESKKVISVLVLMLVTGVLMVVFSDSKTSDNAKEINENNETTEIAIRGQKSELNPNLEYDLKNILSSINGVGKVNILINYNSSSEKIVLKENDGTQSEKTVIIENGETYTPYIIKEESAKIEGVIIVAEGGDKTEICIAVTDAVSALLDLPIHKIKVLKMKG